MARITLQDASLPHNVAADADGDPYCPVHTAHDGAGSAHYATPPATGPRLRTGQYYTADVCLHLPESPANIGAGTSKAPSFSSEYQVLSLSPSSEPLPAILSQGRASATVTLGK